MSRRLCQLSYRPMFSMTECVGRRYLYRGKRPAVKKESQFSARQDSHAYLPSPGILSLKE